MEVKMWSAIKSIFGGGLIGTAGDIARELIDTPLERAQAQVLKFKALDPNGKMRRDIAQTVTSLYKIYILTTMLLLMAQAFDLGNPEQVGKAIKSIVDLFLPITGMFTAIVSASFGVNISNNWKETKIQNKQGE